MAAAGAPWVGRVDGGPGRGARRRSLDGNHPAGSTPGRRKATTTLAPCHHFPYHDGIERLQIQFTGEQAERLRDRARQRKMSTAAVVREAVDAALRDLSGVVTGDERWSRSRAAVGRFGSGKPNSVSEDHDRELEDIYRS